VDSEGYLMIAVRNGDAAHALGLEVNDEVRLYPAGT